MLVAVFIYLFIYSQKDILVFCTIQVLCTFPLALHLYYYLCLCYLNSCIFGDALYLTSYT